MKTLIFILSTFALALALGLVAMDDPGYVLIARAPYEIEISLALFALLASLVFAALYLLVRFVMRTVSARRDLAAWKARRDRDHAGRDILGGYARLIEGDWVEAERELTARVAHSGTPLLNHLGAAYAAQQRGDLARRDAHLDAAATSGSRFRDAIALTRARLQYQAGQVAEARRTLEAMPQKLRRRAVTQRMEAELLRKQRDLQALEQRLPFYRRHGAFTPDEIAELEQQVFSRRFALEAPVPANPNELTRAWSSLPKKKRHDAELVSAYVSKLVEAGEVRRAMDHVLTEMNHNWNPSLLPVYVRLAGGGPELARQLMVWLERHPDDGRLLYELARARRDEGDIEAAQDYYARAIRNGAGESAYLELGALLEREGDTAEALRCYRRGLEVRGRSEARHVERAKDRPRLQSSTADSKES